MMIASDRMGVTLKERRYDPEQRIEELFEQQIPGIFSELVVSLRSQSALLALKLPLGAASPKGMVLKAYGNDLRLLKRYFVEFEGCVRQAIRCAIVTRISGEKLTQEEKTKRGKEKVAEIMERLDAVISPIEQTPLLRLDAERAAKDSDALLAELREEFGEGVKRLLRIMACRIDLLVHADLIGLVEWTAIDVCRYHYFRYVADERVLEKTKRHEHSFDSSQPEGRRHEDKTVSDRLVRHIEYWERHVHHIMEAKIHALDAYHTKVPRRVSEFLRAVPAWLRPLLYVVEGQITMEEIVRRKVTDATVMKSEVIAVDKYSPTIALAEFSLVGWSQDDLDADKTEGKEENPLALGWGGAVAAGLVVLLIFYGFVALARDIVSLPFW